jgi:DNA-binding transcriptional LysR family regulator
LQKSTKWNTLLQKCNKGQVIDLNLLKYFVKVAEHGSYTKAAQALEVPKSKLSRGILRLEKDISTQLIRRTTRSISLTEDGRKLYLNTKDVLVQLDQSIITSTESQDEIKGTLSISVPEDFGHAAFSTILSEFTEQHPAIKIKVLLTNTTVDMTKEGIDLAIRIGNLQDSSLRQKKIGEVELVPVASLAYLKRYGFPRNKEDLKHHKVLSFFNENRPYKIKKKFIGIAGNPIFACNSFPMLKILAVDSQGIAILPDFLCKNEILSKELVQLLPEWNQGKTPIQIVYPYTKQPAAKLRSFIDYLSSKNMNYF